MRLTRVAWDQLKTIMAFIGVFVLSMAITYAWQRSRVLPEKLPVCKESPDSRQKFEAGFSGAAPICRPAPEE